MFSLSQTQILEALRPYHPQQIPNEVAVLKHTLCQYYHSNYMGDAGSNGFGTGLSWRRLPLGNLFRKTIGGPICGCMHCEGFEAARWRGVQDSLLQYKHYIIYIYIYYI